MIHIIGDSHSLTFQESENVCCHWGGALTANRIFTKSFPLEIMAEFPEEEFWFQFGEIDCRIHIYNLHMRENIRVEILTQIAVEKYVAYVVGLREKYNVAIMAVPPQGSSGNVYKYPFYADRIDRQRIADLFNDELKNLCERVEVPFIDVYSDFFILTALNLVDDSFFRPDLCHLKDVVASGLVDNYIRRNR